MRERGKWRVALLCAKKGEGGDPHAASYVSFPTPIRPSNRSAGFLSPIPGTAQTSVSYLKAFAPSARTTPAADPCCTRRARQWQHRDGIPLSGDFDLTAEEITKYEQLTAAAKADPENRAKAEALAERYHEARVDALAKHKSISREEAATRIPKQTPAEREGREQFLQPDDVVEIQGKPLTVAELLAHGSEYDNLAMPDPVEGMEYGSNTAKFFYNRGISHCIHSFAHGLNTVYRLKTLDHRDGITGGNDHRLSGMHSSFDIDRAEPLDRSTFPNQKPGKGAEITLLSTIPNVAHLLNRDNFLPKARSA